MATGGMPRGRPTTPRILLGRGTSVPPHPQNQVRVTPLARAIFLSVAPLKTAGETNWTVVDLYFALAKPGLSLAQREERLGGVDLLHRGARNGRSLVDWRTMTFLDVETTGQKPIE